jgi:hypothetical protein
MAHSTPWLETPLLSSISCSLQDVPSVDLRPFAAVTWTVFSFASSGHVGVTLRPSLRLSLFRVHHPLARIRSHDKYCHNGGMAFAHHQDVGLPRVHDGDHCPFRRSPKNAWLQENGRRVQGSVPLGAAMDSSAFARRRRRLLGRTLSRAAV